MPTPELRLFRVFPWLESSRPGDPGHPLYVHPRQGAGRVDNPEHYLVLYACDSAAGAVAETFGNHSVWTPGLLAGPPKLPGSRKALVTYVCRGARVLDLDDPRALLERQLRPSRVVIRARSITQAWALKIHGEKKWSGVRWWSYWDPRWGAFGLWDRTGLEVADVERLSFDHPAVAEARDVLLREIRA